MTAAPAFVHQPCNSADVGPQLVKNLLTQDDIHFQNVDRPDPNKNLGGTQGLVEGMMAYHSKRATEDEVDERVFISNSKSNVEESPNHHHNFAQNNTLGASTKKQSLQQSRNSGKYNSQTSIHSKPKKASDQFHQIDLFQKLKDQKERRKSRNKFKNKSLYSYQQFQRFNSFNSAQLGSVQEGTMQTVENEEEEAGEEMGDKENLGANGFNIVRIESGDQLRNSRTRNHCQYEFCGKVGKSMQLRAPNVMNQLNRINYQTFTNQATPRSPQSLVNNNFDAKSGGQRSRRSGREILKIFDPTENNLAENSSAYLISQNQYKLQELQATSQEETLIEASDNGPIDDDLEQSDIPEVPASSQVFVNENHLRQQRLTESQTHQLQEFKNPQLSIFQATCSLPPSIQPSQIISRHPSTTQNNRQAPDFNLKALQTFSNKHIPSSSSVAASAYGNMTASHKPPNLSNHFYYPSLSSCNAHTNANIVLYEVLNNTENSRTPHSSTDQGAAPFLIQDSSNQMPRVRIDAPECADKAVEANFEKDDIEQLKEENRKLREKWDDYKARFTQSILDQIGQQCCIQCADVINIIMNQVINLHDAEFGQRSRGQKAANRNSQSILQLLQNTAKHEPKRSRTSQKTIEKSDRNSARSSVGMQPNRAIAGSETANLDPSILISNLKKTSIGKRKSFLLSQSCNSGGCSGRSGNGSRRSCASRKSRKQNRHDSSKRRGLSPIQLFTLSSNQRKSGQIHEEEISQPESPAIPFSDFQNQVCDQNVETHLKTKRSKKEPCQQSQNQNQNDMHALYLGTSQSLRQASSALKVRGSSQKKRSAGGLNHQRMILTEGSHISQSKMEYTLSTSNQESHMAAMIGPSHLNVAAEIIPEMAYDEQNDPDQENLLPPEIAMGYRKKTLQMAMEPQNIELDTDFISKMQKSNNISFENRVLQKQYSNQNLSHSRISQFDKQNETAQSQIIQETGPYMQHQPSEMPTNGLLKVNQSIDQSGSNSPALPCDMVMKDNKFLKYINNRKNDSVPMGKRQVMSNQYLTNVSNFSNNPDKVPILPFRKVGGNTRDSGNRRTGRVANEYEDWTGHYGQGSENYVSVSIDAPMSLDKQEEVYKTIHSMNDNGEYNWCNKKNLPIKSQEKMKIRIHQEIEDHTKKVQSNDIEQNWNRRNNKDFNDFDCQSRLRNYMTEGCLPNQKEDEIKLTLSPIKKFDLQLKEQVSSQIEGPLIVENQDEVEEANGQRTSLLEATQKQNHLSLPKLDIHKIQLIKKQRPLIQMPTSAKQTHNFKISNFSVKNSSTHQNTSRVHFEKEENPQLPNEDEFLDTDENLENYVSQNRNQNQSYQKRKPNSSIFKTHDGSVSLRAQLKTQQQIANKENMCKAQVHEIDGDFPNSGQVKNQRTLGTLGTQGTTEKNHNVRLEMARQRAIRSNRSSNGKMSDKNKNWVLQKHNFTNANCNYYSSQDLMLSRPSGESSDLCDQNGGASNLDENLRNISRKIAKYQQIQKDLQYEYEQKRMIYQNHLRPGHANGQPRTSETGQEFQMIDEFEACEQDGRAEAGAAEENEISQKVFGQVGDGIKTRRITLLGAEKLAAAEGTGGENTAVEYTDGSLVERRQLAIGMYCNSDATMRRTVNSASNFPNPNLIENRSNEEDDEGNITHEEFESVNDDVCDEGEVASQSLRPQLNIVMSPRVNFKTFDNQIQPQVSGFELANKARLSRFDDRHDELRIADRFRNLRLNIDQIEREHSQMFFFPQNYNKNQQFQNAQNPAPPQNFTQNEKSAKRFQAHHHRAAQSMADAQIGQGAQSIDEEYLTQEYSETEVRSEER